MLRAIRMAASLTAALAVGCVEPELPLAQRTPPVILGVERATARRALDSVYWYSGYRPESVVVANGILRVAMPAGSIGQEVQLLPNGCHGAAPPPGVVGLVAREAWKNAGRSAGARTVIVTVGKLEVERKTWYRRTSCASGPAMTRLDPETLDSER